MTPTRNTAQPIRRAVLAVGLQACLAGLAPASAQPANGPLSVVMDDDLLVYNTDPVRDSTLDFLKRSGVDGIRVTVSWKLVSGEE
jgi:hypothetical protein